MNKVLHSLKHLLFFPLVAFLFFSGCGEGSRFVSDRGTSQSIAAKTTETPNVSSSKVPANTGETDFEFDTDSISTFISTWKTDNTGASASKQIKLPLQATGIYDFEADWGDNTSDNITTWNDSAATHTYSAVGTYTIKITGIINGFSFNNVGDTQKILNISQWGPLKLGNFGAYFYGSTNLTITATDILDLTETTNLSRAFSNCIHLSTVPNMNSWNVSQVTTMSYMFAGASSFNQDLSSWNVGTVTDMNHLFESTPFNQDIRSWNVSNVTIMRGMFGTAFNQNISNWNVSNVSNMAGMFGLSPLSQANYDAILIGWNQLPLQNGVILSAITVKYSPGAAATARAQLISNHGWVINDAGQN